MVPVLKYVKSCQKGGKPSPISSVTKQELRLTTAKETQVGCKQEIRKGTSRSPISRHKNRLDQDLWNYVSTADLFFG